MENWTTEELRERAALQQMRVEFEAIEELSAPVSTDGANFILAQER